MQQNSRRQQAVMGVEMIHKLLAMLVVLLVAELAIAETPPRFTRPHPDASLYVLCDAEANSGVCKRDDGAGDEEIVLNASGLGSMTFSSMRSGAGTYTCDIYTRDESYDATPAGNGFKSNVTSLSDTQETTTLSGPFMAVWMNCTLGTATEVTVTVLGQKISR